MHHWWVGLKLTQAARKRRDGAARIVSVISTIDSTVGTHRAASQSSAESREPESSWTGPDGRGRELEIIGVLVDIDGEPAMLIIHAMPTALRRK